MNWFTDPAGNLRQLIGHLHPCWRPDHPALLESFREVIAPELRHDGTAVPISTGSFTGHLYRLLLDAVPGMRPTNDCRDAASNFMMTEQLHFYQQSALAGQTRDRAALTSALEKAEQARDEMKRGLDALEAGRAREIEIAAGATEQLADARLALDAARKQIHELKTALAAVTMAGTLSLSSTESLAEAGRDGTLNDPLRAITPR
jgi:hypothetical protein